MIDRTEGDKIGSVRCACSASSTAVGRIADQPVAPQMRRASGTGRLALPRCTPSAADRQGNVDTIVDQEPGTIFPGKLPQFTGQFKQFDRPARSFSRSCTARTPPRRASATTAGSGLPAVCILSVIR